MIPSAKDLLLELWTAGPLSAKLITRKKDRQEKRNSKALVLIW